MKTQEHRSCHSTSLLQLWLVDDSIENRPTMLNVRFVQEANELLEDFNKTLIKFEFISYCLDKVQVDSEPAKYKQAYNNLCVRLNNVINLIKDEINFLTKLKTRLKTKYVDGEIKFSIKRAFNYSRDEIVRLNNAIMDGFIDCTILYKYAKGTCLGNDGVRKLLDDLHILVTEEEQNKDDVFRDTYNSICNKYSGMFDDYISNIGKSSLVVSNTKRVKDEIILDCKKDRDDNGYRIDASAVMWKKVVETKNIPRLISSITYKKLYQQVDSNAGKQYMVITANYANNSKGIPEYLTGIDGYYAKTVSTIKVFSEEQLQIAIANFKENYPNSEYRAIALN